MTSLLDLQKALEQKAEPTFRIWELWQKYAKMGISEIPKDAKKLLDGQWVTLDDVLEVFGEAFSAKGFFSAFQKDSVVKEGSLRKLLKERPAYLKSYDDGCNKQHLLQLLKFFEDWAKSLEEVFAEDLTKQKAFLRVKKRWENRIK